jgi:hypothetical protein
MIAVLYLAWPADRRRAGYNTIKLEIYHVLYLLARACWPGLLRCCSLAVGIGAVDAVGGLRRKQV